MREEKQLAIFLIATFLMGVTGLLLTGVIAGGKDTVYVKAYRADFYLNGTLSEHFTYEIRETSKYRMLYRVWEAPLSFESLSVPFVEPLSINPPQGTVAYVKDLKGKVWIFENGAWKRSSRHQHRYYEIWSLAERNEAGCYKPERFNAGEQEIKYVFRLHPPLECDGEYCHLNLKLATKHLPYEHVTVAIHDPQGLVERIFTHPPMEIRKEAEGVGEEGKNGSESGSGSGGGSGNVWLITGESPKDTLLEVEMLLSPEVSGIMSGFPRTVEDVKDKTLTANSQYYLTYNIFSALSVILKALILTFPLILLLIYHRYGREKRFTVPKFLSYVPRKRKPWVVNLVFKKDAFDFDEDGFYATLLDLHRRGILRIESDEENLRIKLLKGVEAGEDEYERDVLRFLRDYAEDGVFDAKRFKESVESLRDSARFGGDAMLDLSSLHDRMRRLLKTADKRVAREFVASGRKYVAMLSALFFVLMLVVIALAAVFGSVHPSLNACVAYSLILFVQSLVPLPAPSSLFGKWKRDYYKEKQEWDAFRTFLSDFAAIQKYAPADINMWKEWLVYGTALGVGKKVAEAMKRMQVKVPAAEEADAVIFMPRHFGYMFRATVPPSTTGGAGGFGGFGAGGGFGGGGGGAR
ncbi:MAG: DUF2207 domain-containing protein [Candidatus Methanospirare jalkutatii]|nr:MAG: DUF2207 domain-containing protein [Candidatus Methanospirare jalkutatii]UYZ40449.1 MAG: DUF2207 domain-containing protein [Candidatus Methanospirare jalkutatii]